jgi:hypothetical protein
LSRSSSRRPSTGRLQAACLLLAALTSGCGYSLAGRGSFLPATIRTVAIPQVENRTNVTQIEQIVTERIRNEFIGRGKYQVVTDRAGADAVLSGTINTFFVQLAALSAEQRGTRYLITMTMSVQFTDTKTNDVIWSNDALTFREEYDLGAVTGATNNGVVAAEAFVDQERSSFERIATDLARTVVTAILEAF